MPMTTGKIITIRNRELPFTTADGTSGKKNKYWITLDNKETVGGWSECPFKEGDNVELVWTEDTRTDKKTGEMVTYKNIVKEGSRIINPVPEQQSIIDIGERDVDIVFADKIETSDILKKLVMPKIHVGLEDKLCKDYNTKCYTISLSSNEEISDTKIKEMFAICRKALTEQKELDNGE